MPIQVTITSNIAAILGALDEAVDTAVQAQAEALNERIGTSMEASHGGRTYRLGSKKRGYIYHQASAPGDPPAVETGALLISIQNVSTGPMQAAVYTDDMVGVYQELGTRHIAPRPFFAPAAEAQRDEFNSAIADAVISVLEGSGL